MFLFYVLSFFKKRDTIQGGRFFKEILYYWTSICENAWSSDGSGVFVAERIVQAAAVQHQAAVATEEHHQHVYGTFEHKPN